VKALKNPRYWLLLAAFWYFLPTIAFILSGGKTTG
jgi:hypothetical protein